MDRTQIIEGPAVIQYKGLTIYTLDDIVWSFGVSTIDRKTTVTGIVGTRYDDIISKLTFTPAGVWSHYAQLWKPWETPVIGSSLLGTSDSAVVIWSVDGKKYTIYGAGIVKIPDLDFSATKTFSGQVEIQAVGANDVAWDDAAKRYVEEAAAFAADGIDPDSIVTQPYAASFGASSPWDSFETEDGIKISFDLKMTARKTDSRGTVDLRLSELSVTATFTPVGISSAQYAALFKLQGSGVARGASIGGGANTLIVSGAGVYFRLYGAVPIDPSLKFGADANRCGPVKLQAVRTYSGGAMQPLYYVGEAAP